MCRDSGYGVPTWIEIHTDVTWSNVISNSSAFACADFIQADTGWMPGCGELEATDKS